jgi:uncharacterized cupredoxin-like copper-binding protein
VISRRRAVWAAVAAAVAAVVLGVATTALLAALGAFGGPAFGGPAPGNRWRSQGVRCTAPALAGQVVDVTVGDMGPGMMGGPNRYGPGSSGSWQGMRMMSLVAAPATAAAGTISLRVVNAGVLTHEVVVLPLPAGRSVGQRPIGADGRIDEAGSLGEVSRDCGAGTGDGIEPGGVGWGTFTLAPGRYELVCNFPGHYAAGMFDELDVTGP